MDGEYEGGGLGERSIAMEVPGESRNGSGKKDLGRRGENERRWREVICEGTRVPLCDDAFQCWQLSQVHTSCPLSSLFTLRPLLHWCPLFLHQSRPLAF